MYPTDVWVFVFLTLTGVVAAVMSYRFERPIAYGVSKGMASAGFLGVASTSGAIESTWGSLIFVALVISFTGDIALATRGKTGFLVGLGLFAVAHIVFGVAFVVLGTGSAVLTVTASVAAAVAIGVWTRFGSRIPSQTRSAVGIYLLIVMAMMASGVASAVSHGSLMLTAGVVLVGGSDAAVARQRFFKPGMANKSLGLSAYYLGQTLIALSVAVL